MNKKIVILIFFSLIFPYNSFSANQAATNVQYTNAVCKNTHLISEEFVELHLSGVEWQKDISTCLKSSNFKTILSERQNYGDASLLSPKYILPKGTKVKIVSERSVKHGRGIQVNYSYEVVQAGKKNKIEDSLTYILNQGLSREFGCASIYISPKFFAMREECMKK